jgi:hypothetical protein
MFKVQSGVPLPEISRAPKTTRRKFPVHGMRPGDMFFVPGKTSKSVSAYISRITKDLPGTYSARHCWMFQPQFSKGRDWVLCDPDDEGATEGVGVWRLT